MRNMCGLKLMDKKLTKDLMQMLNLNETTDQLAKANSVRWYGNVLRKDMNNFLRRVLYFKVRGTRKMGDQRKHGLKQLLNRVKKLDLTKVMPLTVQDED